MNMWLEGGTNMLKLTLLLRYLGLVLLFGALAGCSPQFRNHGYIPDQDVLDEIVVGVDTRDSVRETAGPPSSGGVLEGGDFYYVRSRVRSFAHQAPKVIERQVLAVSFNGAGVVENIERFGLEDGRVVVLSRRVTESSKVNVNFIRQILSGIGTILPGGSGAGI